MSPTARALSVVAHFHRRRNGSILSRRQRYGTVASLALIAFVSSCASGAPGGSTAGTSASRPVVHAQDERRVVGEFADIQAVSLSRRLVFALSSSGIAIYDRVFNRWERPFNLPPGVRGVPVSAMSADVVEDAVWFGMNGAVYLFRPRTQSLERAIVPGTPSNIVFDTRNPTEALVTVDGQWVRVSRTGLVTPIGPRLPPGAVLAPRNNLTDVYQKFPSLRNQLLSLFRETRGDRPSTQWTAVSGAVDPDRASEVWLGTNGGGLWKVDPTFQNATPFRFGLHGNEASALVSTGDGVWVAATDRNRRAGLSFATNDLQNWRAIDGSMSVPLTNTRVRDMAIRESHLWLATDRGVVVATLDGKSEMISVTTLNGLPTDNVNAVLPTAGGTYVGTAAGLIQLSLGPVRGTNSELVLAQSAAGRWLGGIPVNALLSGTNQTWIGTNEGLYAFSILNPGALYRDARVPALRIRAMAWSDSTLLIATDRSLLQLALRSEAPAVDIPINLHLLGVVSSLAMDDRTIFVSGSNGLITAPRNAPALAKFLAAGIDLPGPIHDVAISRDWVWLAASGGLVRLNRLLDGTIR